MRSQVSQSNRAYEDTIDSHPGVHERSEVSHARSQLALVVLLPSDDSRPCARCNLSVALELHRSDTVDRRGVRSVPIGDEADLGNRMSDGEVGQDVAKRPSAGRGVRGGVEEDEGALEIYVSRFHARWSDGGLTDDMGTS